MSQTRLTPTQHRYLILRATREGISQGAVLRDLIDAAIDAERPDYPGGMRQMLEDLVEGRELAEGAERTERMP